MDEQEEIQRAIKEGRCIIIATPTRFKDFEPAAASIIMACQCGEDVWVSPHQSVAAMCHSVPISCVLCQLDWCFRWGRL